LIPLVQFSATVIGGSAGPMGYADYAACPHRWDRDDGKATTRLSLLWLIHLRRLDVITFVVCCWRLARMKTRLSSR